MPKPSYYFRRLKGFTLTEILFIVTIFGLGVLWSTYSVHHLSATIGIVAIVIAGYYPYKYIRKLVHSGRLKSYSQELVDKKVEVLKRIPYQDLLITKSKGISDDFNPPIVYDKQNYPPELFALGETQLIRYTLVETTYVNKKTNLFSTSTSAEEEGLKQITVNVIWKEDGKWMVVGTGSKPTKPAKRA